MVYFVYLSYRPNTAVANRAIAYFRSLERLRYPVKVIYFFPDEKYSKLNEIFNYVDVLYCWEHYYFKNSVFKYISYVYYLTKFSHALQQGDKVYIYGLNDIIRKFVMKKGVSVYYEMTEHPTISMGTTKLCKPTIKDHLLFCKKVKKMFVISEKLKQYYIQEGIEEKKIHIIKMTVDTSRFLNLVKDTSIERYIAYCGTASNNKDGVDKLIMAFSYVYKVHPEIKLYIIGDTPSEKDSSHNLELIKKMGLQDNIVFTGKVEFDKMPQILKNAEILALARPDNIQAKYGFPTKLGEYLLTGNPVVVTAVGDIPLYLEDKVNAMVVEPNSPQLFGERMNWLLDNPSEGKRIGMDGMQVALSNFDAYTETKKLIDYINS